MRKVVSYRKETHPGVYYTWFILLALLAPIIAFGGVAKAVSPLLKLPAKENFHPTQTVFYDRNGTKLYETAGAHQPVSKKLDEIPRPLVLATLAAEDADFYKHKGVNPEALVRATYKNIFTNDQQGGSTITQQLIKNTYLSSEKTTSRKLKEMTYAVLLEQKFSKDQILERYLNEVYYGQQSYGVADAAKTYFGKDLNQLTLAEATMLAGLPSSPTRYSPLGGSADLAKKRQKYVLDRMVKLGYVSQDQANEAYAQTLAYAKEEKVLFAPHFVFYVKEQLAKYYGDDVVDSGGLKVYTTLDLNKQQTAQEALTKGVADVASYNASNGALVAMDPRNGEILAMVGSRDFNNDQIDGKVNVADALRQPGSSFKPFVYLEALRQGNSANMVLHDKPTTFYNTFTPKNYDGGYRGNVTLRYSLANSLNIPSVELLDKVGAKPSIDLAKSMGITTLNEPDRYGLSLVLGGGEVKLVDMVSAYGVLANSGTNAGKVSVTKIEDSKGKVIYERKPDPKLVVDPGLAYIMSDILSDNRARTIGFGADSPLNFSRPAAVKTGTTNDYKDNWTIGYTPSLVVGVWVGNNNGDPMRGISGVQGAAPIWNDVMSKLLSGTTVESFKQPGNVVKGCACVRAVGGGVSEYFIKGSAGANGQGSQDTSGDAADQNGRYPAWYIDRNGRRVYYSQ